MATPLLEEKILDALQRIAKALENIDKNLEQSAKAPAA